MDKNKDDIQIKATEEILEILEKYKITKHGLEIILENIEANYRHFGVLKMGVHNEKN